MMVTYLLFIKFMNIIYTIYLFCYLFFFVKTFQNQIQN